MKANYLKVSLFAAFLILSLNTHAQRRQYENNKIGGGIDFNLIRLGLGLDIRAEFPIKQIDLLEGLSIVPKLSYYPWFNRVHELYLGSDVHLGVYNYESWKFYGLVNLSYNGFINYENNLYREDKGFSNFGMDIGGGVKTKLGKCLHPYLELRLNLVFIEPHISLGMLYDLNCDRRGAVPCSKIPPQPSF
ncbi:MAG: hypothetical protein JW801_06040 [Bacteroidales bacterium]|nr:hypothetical protein [Bacteroidales bacterium]